VSTHKLSTKTLLNSGVFVWYDSFMQKKKFSIVCYLKDDNLKKVRSLQKELFDLTGSHACIDAWLPHITVGDGIHVNDKELAEIEKSIADLASGQNIFQVAIGGFGGLTDRKGGLDEITTPYVLWIDVNVNEKLQNLVQIINKQVTLKYDLWYKMPQPYTPHVTLAFRDLTEKGYNEGMEFLSKKEFSDDVKISHISLVEKLPDVDVEYRRFNLA